MEESKQESARVLREAAKVMEVGGYLQGFRGPRTKDDAPHCALGAIDRVRSREQSPINPYQDEIDPAKKALAEMIRPLIPKEGFQDTFNFRDVTPASRDSSIIAGWNNMKAGSAEKVACVMRATADYLEEGEEDVSK